MNTSYFGPKTIRLGKRTFLRTISPHLRALEKAGFVELQEERRKGNCTERILRVSARHYLIDPEALGMLVA